MITSYPCGCVYAGGSPFCVLHERGLPPGIAPAIPVHPDQIAIAHRLGTAARSLRPGQNVTVMAGDLLALLNAFWQESRRADVAEARLESLTAASVGQSAPSSN